MKKFGALALAVALTASLSVPALAAEEDKPLLIAPAPISEELPEEVEVPYIPGVPYAATLVLNGVTVDASAVPDAPGIPLRLLAESDHGSAYWDAESGEGTGYLDGYRVTVNVSTLAITVNDEPVEGVSAIVKDGFTFVPVEVIDGLDGYSVNTNPELDVNRYDISTPNGAPLVKLAYDIREASGMANGMKGSIAEYTVNYSLPEGTFEDGVTFFGFNTTPDCMVLGKLAEGADAEAVKTALEAQKQGAIDTFTWYLGHNLPKAEAGQIVFNGDYVLFLIAEDAEKGVELFNAFVAEQTQA